MTKKKEGQIGKFIYWICIDGLFHHSKRFDFIEGALRCNKNVVKMSLNAARMS
jgi:hypothetical protein